MRKDDPGRTLALAQRLYYGTSVHLRRFGPAPSQVLAASAPERLTSSHCSGVYSTSRALLPL